MGEIAPGSDSHIKRMEILTGNFEKSPEEVPRSSFVGMA